MNSFALYDSALLYYIVLINTIAFLLYGMDKFLAIKGFWRFRDSTLIAVAIFGGTIGAITGQRVFRHKTKKYRYVIPLVLLIQFALAVYFWL